MKKILLLLIGCIGPLIVKSQVQFERIGIKWSLDATYMIGHLSQNISTANIAANYPKALNPNISNLKFTDGISNNIEIHVSRFFGKGNFGMGLGIIFTRTEGNLSLDNFHIEYQSTDYQDRVFRQLITAINPITERVKASNISIPLLIKYKTRFTKGKVGFAIDAGAIYSINLVNSYTTNAAFDYEAIYQFIKGANNTSTAVYDNSPVPSTSKDWLITQSQFSKNNPNEGVSNFESLRSEGYNIGLAVKPDKNSGTAPNGKFSIGILLRPQISIMMSQKFFLNFGTYYIYQLYKKSVENNYRLIDKVGSYSSLLNSITSSRDQSYGINFGIEYRF